MAVETLNIYATFSGDGVTTAFPFSIPVQFASDLALFYTDPTGVVSSIPQNEFSVILNPGDPAQGGYLAFMPGGVAAPVGSVIALMRYVAPLQSVQINNQDGFEPVIVTDEFDRLTMVDQQLTDGVARALTLPPGDPATGTMVLPGPTGRAGNTPAFDGNGNLILVPTSAGGGGGGPTVPSSAPLLGSSSAGSLVSVGIGAGLSITGGDLVATEQSLPVNASLLATDSLGDPQPVALGTGVSISAGTLSATAAALPDNASLLATNSGGTATAVSLGSGVAITSGTLSATAASVPANAFLLGSNSSSTLEPVSIGQGIGITGSGGTGSGGTLYCATPLNASLLSTGAVHGQFQPVNLGAGLSLTTVSGTKTLQVAANAPPVSAPLVGTNGSGVFTPVVAGPGIVISSGTLSAASASLPVNAPILATNSGGTATALAIGANLSISAGTLSATGGGSSLPASAQLLASNSGGTATAVVVGAGLSENSGTLSVTAASLPANAPILATNSGGTATALAIGAGLASSGGTLSATALSVPASAPLLASNSGGTLTSVVLGTGLSESAGTLTATAAALPTSASLLATNSGGTATAITLGTGLSESAGTLTLSGGAGSLAVTDGTHTVTGVTELIVATGGSLTASGTGTATLDIGGGGGGPYIPPGSGQIYGKQHCDFVKQQVVAASGTYTLMNYTGGAGVMTKIFLGLTGDSDSNSYSTLEFYVDGESTAALMLDLQLGFFNGGYQTFATAYIGKTPGSGTVSGGYLYMNVPFSNSLRVVFTNGSSANSTTIWSYIQYAAGGTYNWGNYKRLRNNLIGAGNYPGNLVSVAPYAEQTLLNYTGGAGVFWGLDMVLDLNSSGNGSLEGQIKIYIDGETTASFQTSGTEEYFGGSFYFSAGQLSSDFAGCVWSYSSQYIVFRRHILDPIPFSSSIKVTWSNGFSGATAPGAAALISSNALYYTAN